MPERFRKKPVLVEALQWDGESDNAQAIVSWINANGGDAQFISVDGLTHSISISTLEGEMCAVAQDWIIRGLAGEFYPCKPAIFEESYERVL